MRTLSLIALFCFIATIKLVAQTPQAVEADLLKSFKKIEYWDDQQNKGVDGASESLGDANDEFGNKLKKYAETYPASINMPFNSLKKAQLDILTSADGLFRIYSWETWQGGTMRDFSNVLQYKAGAKTKSVLLTGSQETYIPFYSNLYTFKSGDKTYYLGIYGTIYSGKDAGTGIRVFDIENGMLNDDAKIIKTGSGLKSKIYYDYDFFSVVDIPFEKRPTITFDQATQTIRIPLVNAKAQVTSKFINYKFNGQYFEKIKS
ncbi:hypothetical protein MTO98_05495 [Mucilaginibacter sp. SMC90]|uniref:hypothetical protein n=1 Tax=Mucilaginibacter sp. SMC90 TaxID=2929803 RepID=UPI001FB50B57|nr:hypothetical protein [Mucilaginibacter sp. SMC90]UOE50527.1 hypothetical protein MTO98_05495 [Mucilaginibacter sp. SMC90]